MDVLWTAAGYSSPAVATGSAAFSPGDIAGMVLWLAADDIVGLSNNDPVVTWEDGSAEGNDVTQAAAGQRPVYKTNVQNSLPGVLFDGSDDVLGGAHDTSLDLTGDQTIFAVYSSTDTTGHIFTNYNFGTFEGWGFSFGIVDSGKQSYWSSGKGSWVGDSAAINDGTPRLGAVKRASGTITFYVNGTAGNSNAGHSNVAPSGSHLVGGDPSGNDDFTGYIHEVIVYNSALSDANREAVEDYLLGKWGL